jgi:hypothetical protein
MRNENPFLISDYILLISLILLSVYSENRRCYSVNCFQNSIEETAEKFAELPIPYLKQQGIEVDKMDLKIVLLLPYIILIVLFVRLLTWFYYLLNCKNNLTFFDRFLDYLGWFFGFGIVFYLEPPPCVWRFHFS